MPIYEYVCQKCGQKFELLIRNQDEPKCPECGSPKLEKLLSVASVSTSSTTSGQKDLPPCGAPPGCCQGSCDFFNS